jgi:hypothetical protein
MLLSRSEQPPQEPTPVLLRIVFFVDADTIIAVLPTLLHTFEVTLEVFDCPVKPGQNGLRQVVDSQSCAVRFSQLLRKLPSLCKGPFHVQQLPLDF